MVAHLPTRCCALLLTSCCVISGCTVLPTSGPVPEEKAVGEEAMRETSETDKASTTTEIVDGEASGESATESQAPPETTASPQRDFFREGVNRAQSAVAIGQSAQSTEDWKLAESRWQQAVLLMQQVPSSDSNYATAQEKAQEYQQNANQAAQRAAAGGPGTPSTSPSRPDGLVAQIPIVDRLSGIPVVPVTLTGNSGTQRYTMLFDTGASGTLITAAMAREVGVVIVDEAVVTVADGRQVKVPIGYVDTLEVGGLVVHDLLVGIGGDVGLLGQDVYGQYGISAGGSSINLYK